MYLRAKLTSISYRMFIQAFLAKSTIEFGHFSPQFQDSTTVDAINKTEYFHLKKWTVIQV